MTIIRVRAQKKPLKKRQSEIRAFLRTTSGATITDVAQAFDLSENSARRLLVSLVERNEVHVAYKEPTSAGGLRRHVYELTDTYLRRFDPTAFAQRSQKRVVPWTVIYTPPPEQPKPWYRRVVGWLTGRSDARA